MQHLELAVRSLEEAVTTPPRFVHSWRHLVRRRLNGVHHALGAERTACDDSWLSARAAHLHRERDRLLARVSMLAAMVTDGADVESVRRSLMRLVQDVEHHHQRVNDLAYDGVAAEVGGSE